MFATGISQEQCLAAIQGKLKAIRDSLDAAKVLHAWAAGLSTDEIAAATGLSGADAQTLQSAMADADGLSDLYSTGTDGRNPPPGPGYVYGASQIQVIGPV